MKNIPFIIAGLIAAFILLGSCNADPQTSTARTGGDLADGEQAAPPPGGQGAPTPVDACAAVLAQAQAAGDDLTGDTDLYYRHLEVCHTDPPTAPTTAPTAPTTTEQPPPITELATTTTADLADLV